MNNNDREQWINNHEELYKWFRSSRLSMTEFLRRFKNEIDSKVRAYEEERRPDRKDDPFLASIRIGERKF